MVTIKEIAQLAGVAKSTVSRYLNGGSISRKTAAKVDKVIKETGYIPSTFAQSLKAKESKIIGVVLPRFDSYYISAMVDGADFYLYNHGYKLMIIHCQSSDYRSLEAIQLFKANKVDGILCFTGITDFNKEDVLHESTPLLGVSDFMEKTDYIDYIEGGRILAEYLYQKGHRELTYLNTQWPNQMDYLHSESFKKAFNAFDGTYIKQIDVDMTDDTEAKQIMEQNIEEILAEHPKLIVGSDDISTLSIMKLCLRRNIKIPEDISLASFGNHPVAKLYNPGLTTINYPFYEIGQSIGSNLLSLIQEREISTDSFNLVPELIERESVTNLTQK